MPNIQLIQPATEQLYQLNRFYRRNGHKGKAKPSDTAFWLEPLLVSAHSTGTIGMRHKDATVDFHLAHSSYNPELTIAA